jgi:phosphoribosylaminoimidazolecarboxamide formyltransferase/IMP cyclohydrolase
VREDFEEPACVIVKHANPCGVAIGADCARGLSQGLPDRPTSAFGGIIAFNRPLDGAAAEQVAKQFVEVLMAPAFTPRRARVFKARSTCACSRLRWTVPAVHAPTATQPEASGRLGPAGAVAPTTAESRTADLKVVTKGAQPAADRRPAVRLAWRST